MSTLVRMKRLLLAVVIVVLSACANPTSSKTTTTTKPRLTSSLTTGASSTSVAPPPPATTAAVTPPSAVVTTAVAATAPPPTADPEIDAAIRLAVVQVGDIRAACLDQPASCDVSKYARGTYRVNDQKFVDQMVARNARLRLRPEDPSYTVVGSIEVSSDGRAASVTACTWDTDIIFGPGGAIFNDAVVSQESVFRLAIEDESWFVVAIDEVRTIKDQNTCGSRP